LQFGIKTEFAYIWVSPNLVNDGVIEVSRITQEIASDVVSVLEALEDVLSDWH